MVVVFALVINLQLLYVCQNINKVALYLKVIFNNEMRQTTIKNLI